MEDLREREEVGTWRRSDRDGGGGGEAVDGLERKQEDFELNTELNREPVELLEDRSDVVDGGGLSYDAGS